MISFALHKEFILRFLQASSFFHEHSSTYPLIQAHGRISLTHFIYSSLNETQRPDPRGGLASQKQVHELIKGRVSVPKV